MTDEPDVTPWLPHTLGEIIQRNRDRWLIRLANEVELAGLTGGVDMDQVRGRIVDWRIIAIVLEDSRSFHVLGDDGDTGLPYITSRVVVMSSDRHWVRTRNSLYRLAAPGDGQPSVLQLLHLCAALHDWGVGQQLGAPLVYY